MKKKNSKLNKEKMIKLKLKPPLWIEDWGDEVTFEHKDEQEHPAKFAVCLKEIEVPLSEILKKLKKIKR